MKCQRCGVTLKPPIYYVVAYGLKATPTCEPCVDALEERIETVAEGWYADPLTEEGVKAYGERAAKFALEGDMDGWERVTREYVRAVMFRERDDPPDVCLAGAMRGASEGASAVGLELGLEKAAHLIDAMRKVDCPKGAELALEKLAFAIRSCKPSNVQSS